MATDEERLLVRIEAQLRQFERAMAQATGGADRAAGRIERRFRGMERNLSQVGAGFARSLLGPLAALVSAREIGQAADAFTRIENALKIAGLSADEASAVFERLFAAAQKNAAPIESLVELYGRAALVQKELGVSSEELLRFTEGVAAALRVSGKSAAESSGALLQLSQALGSGVVRAEEFNSILEGALPIAQAAARGLKEAGGSVAALRTLVIDGKVSSEAFFRAFQAGQGTLESLAETTDVTLGGAMTKLQNSFIKLVGYLDDTTGASDGLRGALGGLADAFDKLPGLVDAFRSSLEDLNRSNAFLDFLIVTKGEAEDFTKRLGEMQEAAEGAGVFRSDPVANRIADALTVASEAAGNLNDNLELTAALQKKVVEQGGDLIAGPAPGAAPKPVSLEDFAPPSTRGGGSRGGGGPSPVETFERDLASIRERTAALHVEAAAVGKSRFEAEKMIAVQELLNEAKRAGLTITPELTAKINEEATAYANAKVNLEQLEEEQRRAEDAMRALQDAAGDVMKGFISDLREGKSAAEAFAGVLDKIADKLIDLAINALTSGLFGGGGLGGIIGSIIGGPSTAGGAAPLAAPGGVPVAANANRRSAPAVVQLFVDEGALFVPRVAAISGTVSVQQIKRYDRAAPGSLSNRQARGIA